MVGGWCLFQKHLNESAALAHMRDDMQCSAAAVLFIFSLYPLHSPISTTATPEPMVWTEKESAPIS